MIQAIQLDYSEAHKNLMNAIRKAPQQVAIGFKQHVRHIMLYILQNAEIYRMQLNSFNLNILETQKAIWIMIFQTVS